jgi:hypothetical protein
VNFADILDAFNWMDRLEGLVSSLTYADWKGALKKAGPTGLVGEAARTLAGENTWTFHIDRNACWSGGDAERLLKHYGVRLWGRRVTGHHFILTVEQRQANWAEYLLLRRGMSLDGRLFNPDNQRYAQKYAPGDQPPARADRGREPPDITRGTRQALGEPEPRDIVDRLGDLF